MFVVVISFPTEPDTGDYFVGVGDSREWALVRARELSREIPAAAVSVVCPAGQAWTLAEFEVS
jgi:hypothetical protein